MLKNVLVLGGLGFVGRNVCKVLHAQGVVVYAIGHGSIEKAEISSWGITQWVEADINLNNLTQHFASIAFDAVIHCAGSGAVSLAYQQPFEDYQRSVTSVMATLEFVRTTQFANTRFVLASSAAVYGNQDKVLTELSTLQPISPYGLHKQAAENLCSEYSNYFAINCSVVRLFSIYGVGLQKQLLWDAASKFRQGKNEFFGTGEEMRDWLSVMDAALLLVYAALKTQSVFEIYNGGNHHASISDVLNCLAMGLGATQSPQFTGQTHLGNPRWLLADSSKAAQMLGWQATTPFATGIQAYAEWFNYQHA